MIADFRRRFWVSAVLTIPILLLSEMIQHWFGIEAIAFAGQDWVVLVLSSIVFFYDGWPFLTGLKAELKARRPGMMTLISLAIIVAYAYSAALVVLRLEGEPFFWELANLIDAKMVQNLLWATGYNAFAIPLAAGIAYGWGIVLTPAVGAALMSLSTVIVAINAKLLERARSVVTGDEKTSGSATKAGGN